MKVDAVIHAGDLYDSGNPSLDDVIRTISLLTILKENDIPFYGIVGNHEGKRNSQWLDLFESMGLAFRLSERPVRIAGKNNDIRVSVYGIDNLSAPRLRAYDFSCINEMIGKNERGDEEKTETDRDREKEETDGNREKTETDGNRETDRNREKTETDGNREKAETDGNREKTGTDGNREDVITERNKSQRDARRPGDFAVLVLHQLLTPVLPAQPVSVYDFLDRIDESFDAVLLGDNHSYECVQIPCHEEPDFEGIPKTPSGKTWVTYPGSTERCNAAETDPRSYNLVTFSEDGLMITRRNIPTRPFVVITIPCENEDEQDAVHLIKYIFSKIDDYAEKIRGAVVFAELRGVKETIIQADIEDYILKYGAVVAKVSDRRDTYEEEGATIGDIPYHDPDEVVRDRLKRLNLTEAGLLADSIIRSPEVVKTRVADDTEEKISGLMDEMSFDKPVRRAGPLEIPDDQETAAGDDQETAAGDDQERRPGEDRDRTAGEDRDQMTPDDQEFLSVGDQREMVPEDGSAGSEQTERKYGPDDFESFKKSVMSSGIFGKAHDPGRPLRTSDLSGPETDPQRSHDGTGEKTESEDDPGNRKKISPFRLSDFLRETDD